MDYSPLVSPTNTLIPRNKPLTQDRSRLKLSAETSIAAIYDVQLRNGVVYYYLFIFSPVCPLHHFSQPVSPWVSRLLSHWLCHTIHPTRPHCTPNVYTFFGTSPLHSHPQVSGSGTPSQSFSPAVWLVSLRAGLQLSDSIRLPHVCPPGTN